MEGSCTYFDSNAWDQRLNKYVQRSWDLEHFLRESDAHVVEDSIVEIADEIDGVDADNVAQLPIGEVLEEVGADHGLSMEVIRETWKQQAKLPEACPHDIHDSSERFCLCHMSPSKRQKVGINSVDMTEWIMSRLGSGEINGDAYSFVGARFRRFDLSSEIISTADNRPIDFRYIRVIEEVDCRDTVFKQTVQFKGARLVSQPTSANGREELQYGDHFIDFDADIDFTRTEFRQKADFKFVLFNSDISFNNACFNAGMFNYGQFIGRTDFMAATFDGKADFSKARFERAANLNAKYNSAAIYNYTSFYGDVAIWTTTFRGKAEFWAATFHSNLNARYAEFCDETRFEEVRFEGQVIFDHASFHEDVYFRDVSSVEVISLRQAVLSSGMIRLPKLTPSFYDLRQAIVGNVNFCAQSDPDDELFEYFYLQETEFEGFDFSRYNDKLRPDWIVHTNTAPDTPFTLETDPAALETTYLKAKSGANEVGHNKAASEFFFHEMKFRKQQHARQALNDWSRITSDPASKFQSGFISGIKWVSNATLGYTAGYGERPRNVVFSSLTIILIFAILYALLDTGNIYNGGIGEEYLLLSFQSFITFILGGAPEGATFWFEFISAIQGFIGAFLIALLVFTLTRSIHR